MKNVIKSVSLKTGLMLTALLFLPMLSTIAEARDKLTKAEVQKIFIGKHWSGPDGRFIFRPNGTYEYNKHDGSVTFRGNYTMKPDGTLKGKSTSYRFYRKRDGSYLYYHTRSRRFFSAKLL